MTTTTDVPKSTALQLGSIIKSCRDIMRKDKGMNGDLDRLPMLTWIMFLKFLDDTEVMRQEEAKLSGTKFRQAIDSPYRWRDWAAKQDGMTGPELIAFINNDEATRQDGSRGLGLFTYLRSLQSANGDRRDVIAKVFEGTVNRMTNGYLLRDVLNKVNDIHFASRDEIHTLGHLYESMLREMRDAAGDSGEFYTPRAVVKFIVSVINPYLGETVLDPAAGTGGFLVEAFEHLKRQCKKTEDYVKLQKSTLSGIEAKHLPYLLCQMNLLLHGVEYPDIDPLNALRFALREIGDKDRVDVIMTNPPFGGEEEKGILSNFPEDRQTAETALLFLQLIMKKLRRLPRAGRAAVVVPNTTLFYGGVASKIRRVLIDEFNLRAVVRLPKGVFEPYTDIETNILFFDGSGATSDILFYQLTPPIGRTKYSKTQPIKVEEFDECLRLIKSRSADSPNAWFVKAVDIGEDDNNNLDQRNPKIVRSTGEHPRIVCEKFTSLLGLTGARLSEARTHIDELDKILSSRDGWVRRPLRAVLKRRKDVCEIEDGSTYKRLRIQVKGRGVLLRDEVDGEKIGTKRQFRVSTGQFILSKIDARNGAFGIVPEEGDGAIITGNFWTYDVDTSIVSPQFLQYLTRSDSFRDFCENSSPGATNRRYLQEEKFLDQEFDLPNDLEVQNQLCEMLDVLSSTSRMQEIDLAKLSKTSPLLLQSSLHLVFGGAARDTDSDVKDKVELDDAVSEED